MPNLECANLAAPQAREIQLSNGHLMLVDEVDFERVSKFRWRARRVSSVTYARSATYPSLIAHRLILGAASGEVVDHVNRNGLDNRRANLRLCTTSQNQRNATKRADNTSGFKGVTLDKARGLFVAQFYVHGRHITVGRFSTALEAARAYDAAAIRHFGEFARTNAMEGRLA